jgi:SAM-dependent methyltransferase
VTPYQPLDNRAVLDLGAGTGGLLLKCQEYQPARLVGLEVDTALYELAKLRLRNSGIEFLLKFDTATLFASYFSYFSLKRLVVSAGFTILEINSALRYKKPPPPFLATLGENYPWLERLIAMEFRVLGKLRSLVVPNPEHIFSIWIVRLFDPELFAILKK